MSMFPFLLGLIAVESCALAFTAWRQSPTYVRKIILVQMILIALFAPKLFDVAGFQSNVGSIFYATVFMSQLVVSKRWSMALAMENVWTVLGSMVVFYLLVGILGAMPAVNAHDTIFTRAIYDITSATLLNAAVSLVAFVGAQFVLLGTLERFKDHWWGASLAVVLGQIVDSAIFYPVVFHAMPLALTIQVAVDGFITKLACAVALIPAYLYAVQRHPEDLVARLDRRNRRHDNHHD